MTCQQLFQDIEMCKKILATLNQAIDEINETGVVPDGFSDILENSSGIFEQVLERHLPDIAKQFPEVFKPELKLSSEIDGIKIHPGMCTRLSSGRMLLAEVENEMLQILDFDQQGNPKPGEVIDGLNRTITSMSELSDGRVLVCCGHSEMRILSFDQHDKPVISNAIKGMDGTVEAIVDLENDKKLVATPSGKIRVLSFDKQDQAKFGKNLGKFSHWLTLLHKLPSGQILAGGAEDSKLGVISFNIFGKGRMDDSMNAFKSKDVWPDTALNLPDGRVMLNGREHEVYFLTFNKHGTLLKSEVMYGSIGRIHSAINLPDGKILIGSGEGLKLLRFDKNGYIEIEKEFSEIDGRVLFINKIVDNKFLVHGGSNGLRVLTIEKDINIENFKSNLGKIAKSLPKPK